MEQDYVDNMAIYCVQNQASLTVTNKRRFLEELAAQVIL